MSFDFRVRMLLKGAVTLQRVIQKQHVESALRKIPREVSRKRSVRLMSDRAKDLKTFEMGIGSFPYYGSSIDIKACKKSRLWKLASCPTPLTDTSKMHSVVVFVDMAGDLRVVVKHSNSPFVFCNPSFQFDRSIRNCSWWNWFCTLCQIVTGQPFPGVLVAEQTAKACWRNFREAQIFNTSCIKYFFFLR